MIVFAGYQTQVSAKILNFWIEEDLDLSVQSQPSERSSTSPIIAEGISHSDIEEPPSSAVERGSRSGKLENRDGSGNSYTEATISNPSGTTVHRTSQEAGQPAVSETTRLPAGGSAAVQGGVDSGRRIEDVTESDADREYEERIEDEYAKREGGA
ncbi:MAG: hypothetical protein Q9213_004547 [Squamulea squamosa]